MRPMRAIGGTLVLWSFSQAAASYGLVTIPSIAPARLVRDIAGSFDCSATRRRFTLRHLLSVDRHRTAGRIGKWESGLVWMRKLNSKLAALGRGARLH